MRALAPVLVVLILCASALLTIWLTRKQTVRRRDLTDAKTQVVMALCALDAVLKEIKLQVDAQRPDLHYLDELVRQEERKIQEVPYRKEISR